MLIQPRRVVVRWIAAAIIALGIVKAITLVARGEDWYFAAKSCGKEVAESLGGCGSCSGAWPQISRCVVHRVAPTMPSWVVDACIATVRDRTQNQNGAYDRVGPVLACATRESVH